MTALPRIAYSLDEFAEVVSLSKAQIRKHIAAGELVPSYSGTKPIIPVAEAQRFIESLPVEPRKS